MKPEQTRCLFNALIFLLAGIISLVRHEALEAVISFAFCGVFFSLSAVLRESETDLLPEKVN